MSDYVEMRKWRRLAVALFIAFVFTGLVSAWQNRVIQIQRKQIFSLWDAYVGAAHGCGDKNFVQ